MPLIYGDHNQRIAKLKELLLSGELTTKEMEQRLVALINEEMCKPVDEIDAVLLSMCEDILWNMHSEQTRYIPSDFCEKTYPVFLKKRKREQSSKHLRKQIIKAACLAAILVFVISMGKITFDRQKLIIQSTSDEQRYEVLGETKNPPGANDAQAAENGEIQPEMISTSNLEDIESFMGYNPSLPIKIPDGWKISYYIGAKFASYDQIIANYEMEGEQYLLQIEILKYEDAEYAQQAFEQNENGEIVKVSNGLEIYITNNLDSILAIWVDNLDCYKISGPISRDALLDMVNSIMK